MSVANWQWFYDSERQLLKLAVDELVVDIDYPRAVLQTHLPDYSSFDINDADAFHRLHDYLESYSSLNMSEQFQACIHAVAALRFMKPALPQSWHFCFNQMLSEWPSEHLACTLDSGLDSCEFLIIEQGGRTSLCLLLAPSMRLSPTKVMRQYEVIRVLNDRLQESESHPLPQQRWSDWSSLA